MCHKGARGVAEGRDLEGGEEETASMPDGDTSPLNTREIVNSFSEPQKLKEMKPGESIIANFWQSRVQIPAYYNMYSNINF